MEKQDFINEKQKEIISTQGEVLTQNIEAIGEQEKKFEEVRKAVSEKEET